MVKVIMAVLTTLIVMCCSSGTTKNAKSSSDVSKIKLIFETDMGNDVDDALALDMTYKYVEAGKVDLLGIMSNKNCVYSAEFIDIMATWYGHEEIPIGIVRNGIHIKEDAVNYAKAVCELEENGQPMFKRTLNNYESLPAAPLLYRKILSQQPDSSVVIVSVGFSTNLAQLLDTKPDKHSLLNGRELVAKKVKVLSIMAGSFGKDSIAEHNVLKDVRAAKKVFVEWPSQIVVSPFEVGIKILYPGASIVKDFNWGIKHPMIKAYKVYLTMPYDRPTWDLTSLMYVVEDDKSYMNESVRGKITVNNEGYTCFKEDVKGKHSYLSVTDDQVKRVEDHLVNLIKQKPLKYKGSEKK